MRLLPILPMLLVLLAACESQPIRQASPAKTAIPAPPATRPALATVLTPIRADSVPTFSWQDEVCTNTGTYDSQAYTRQQVAGTYQVAVGFGLLPTPDTYRLAGYTDSKFRQTAARLERAHDSLASMLHALTVVPTPFWRQLKHLRELQLAEQYEQSKLELAGYFAPASLHTSRYYTHCATYADALASADTAVVLRAWRHLIVEEKVNNADPEQFDEEYAAAIASPDGLRHAKMRLLGMGWHNCTNARSQYNELDNKYQPLNKFEKLFRHVEQSGCVDVD